MEDDPPPAVPEWVVTYGDMMSLLLTFFIMLVSLSETAGDKQYRAIVQALESYLGYNSGPMAPPGKFFPGNSSIKIPDTNKLGSHSNKDMGGGGVKRESTRGPDIKVSQLREGESISAGPPLLFQADQLELLDKQLKTLQDINQNLAGKPNKIEIRAWANPISENRVRSDAERIEISYKRAETIYNYLIAQGMSEVRLRVSVEMSEHFRGEKASTEKNSSDMVGIVVLDEFHGDRVGRIKD
jgi:chemotaxis protein MotB